MKRNTKYIILATVSAIVLLGTLHTAHAASAASTAWAVGKLLYNPIALVGAILSIISYLVVTVLSWLLAASGTLLNMGMYLTTHMQLFTDKAPVIYTVWAIIRDLCSTLLIFFILYAAVQMILGLKNASYGTLIKNIIIIGILINFSFFFTRVLIDLSNIVSLEFYNAIAPTNSVQQSINTNGGLSNLSSMDLKLFRTGGISNIMMSSLQVTSFWTQNGKNVSDIIVAASDIEGNIKIIITEIVAAGIIVITTINFLVIALAAVSRLTILIFLLCFSPLWIAAFAIPQLKAFSDKWFSLFKSQLLFLPIYLAFLYVALRIIVASNLGNQLNTTSTGDPLGVILNYILSYTIIFFLLNIPFIAAVQGSGLSSGLIQKAYGGMMNKVKGWTKSGLRAGASGTWNNTGGRIASRIAQNDSFQTWAGKYRVGQLALQSTRGVATNFNKNLDAKVKSREDFAKTLNRDGATAYANRLSGSVSARVGTSIMHTVGRADRVGAAKIFNTRETEIKADLNRLTGELNQINNAAAAATATGGLASLPIWQQQRHAELTGTTSTLNPTGKNEISVAQTDLTNIRTQISNFQRNTGETTSKTARRNY